LFSSHILGDVERVADRIGVIVNGVLRVDCPMETFRESVRKLILEFAGCPPESPAIPGMVSWRHVGNDLEIVLAGYDDQQRQAVESLAPLSIEVLDLNLEDAFIEYTRGPRRSLPLFATESKDVEIARDQGAA
jgi:ABC-2 type transport system ATP-binding protein